MLQLHLLRHGKAVKFTDESSDFQRHLNKQGTAQANVLGYILKQRNYKPNQIIASSAVRTAQTAEIVRHHLDGTSIEYHADLFLAERSVILHRIHKTGKGKNLLYIGHNNGISDLVSWLTGKQTTLATCQCAVIEFPFDDWNLISGNTGNLIEVITPDVVSF
ncbi:MAG: histidine phosphatase family protein [Crocinitomicaceae bacterium]|nr:histidine phosphatase family protein [Crocinitomicaceae bacterium]MBK8926814.1 histidine phosphatase family protein [Crocinitomicaceae bacterium]